jgi:hypothetical protein
MQATPPNPESTGRLPSPRWRMSEWLLAAIALSFVVWWMAPQQLPVSLYKLSLVALAAVAGYWIDRSLFPYARPDVFLALDADAQSLLDADDESDSCVLSATPDETLLRLMGICMLRRAIIVAATMLAVGLGA